MMSPEALFLLADLPAEYVTPAFAALAGGIVALWRRDEKREVQQLLDREAQQKADEAMRKALDELASVVRSVAIALETLRKVS